MRGFLIVLQDVLLYGYLGTENHPRKSYVLVPMLYSPVV